jgi:hypothetical protein
MSTVMSIRFHILGRGQKRNPVVEDDYEFTETKCVSTGTYSENIKLNHPVTQISGLMFQLKTDHIFIQGQHFTYLRKAFT